MWGFFRRGGVPAMLRMMDRPMLAERAHGNGHALGALPDPDEVRLGGNARGRDDEEHVIARWGHVAVRRRTQGQSPGVAAPDLESYDPLARIGVMRHRTGSEEYNRIDVVCVGTVDVEVRSVRDVRGRVRDHRPRSS